MRRVRHGLALLLLAGAAQAAERYPARPVRLIVPFPPGGSDTVARMAAQRLTDRLGQQFVVDNRPGAAGTLGANIAAKARNDGYTILFVTSSFAISAATTRELPYDASRDFHAIGQLASGPFCLVIHPSLQANNVKELVALARARPGQINYASAGTGAVGHIDAEMFRYLTGTRITHIPYKGSALALTAVVAGEAQMMFAPLGTSIPFAKSGKLKILGVASGQRSTLMPELPTVAEAGVPGYEAGTWYGLVAPAGTQKHVIERLDTEIVQWLQQQDTREKLNVIGFEPSPMRTAAFDAFIRSEIRKWKDVTQKAGIVIGER